MVVRSHTMSRHSQRPSDEQMQEASAMEAISSNNETITDNQFSVPQHLSSGTITRSESSASPLLRDPLVAPHTHTKPNPKRCCHFF